MIGYDKDVRNGDAERAHKLEETGPFARKGDDAGWMEL
jgi:hypothetical protein